MVRCWEIWERDKRAILPVCRLSAVAPSYGTTKRPNSSQRHNKASSVMDSNDSSANTAITFGDAAAPAPTTSDDDHLTVSSSSEDKSKKSAEKRCQDLFRRQEMRKESRSRPTASGARSSSTTSSNRKVISDSVKKKSGESTPPARRSPRGSPSTPQPPSGDGISGVPHGSPQRDSPYGQSHGVDTRTVEELQARLAEMAQEDEGATLRIMQLERERDNALALVRHVHERHQSEQHQQEARHQLRERHLLASENEIRLQQVQAQELRDEAAQAVLQIGQQSQGEMFDMAKEYQRMTQMLHHKATENSALRSDLRFAEQLMMEAKEAMERSEVQESYIAAENQQARLVVMREEQQMQNMNQEFQRLREAALEEITAEWQRYAQLEVNQRPVLPSLHEEIVNLRAEMHVQNSELRAARSELHVASARSSEWEHAGNSVGFPSTHVSHTPVTVVSPAGSNSRNGSNSGTPEKGIENTVPPAPQGPPVTYGPESSVTYGPDLATSVGLGKSSFGEFADGLFGNKTKGLIAWGSPAIYDERLLDNELRGVLQVRHDSSINALHANAIAALAVHLTSGGPPLVANYDSSQVAAQFMDVIFCGLIYDFWPSFERFYRLPYPDMLIRFKEGSRHDALGTWPIVELDESTGLPRDLTDAEIIAKTRQPEMKEWRHKRYKMHKLLSIAVRGCIALDFHREHFNIKDHNRNTVREHDLAEGIRHQSIFLFSWKYATCARIHAH